MDKNIYETAEKIILAMLEQNLILTNLHKERSTLIKDDSALEEYNQSAVKHVMSAYQSIINELKKIQD